MKSMTKEEKSIEVLKSNLSNELKVEIIGLLMNSDESIKIEKISDDLTIKKWWDPNVTPVYGCPINPNPAEIKTGTYVMPTSCATSNAQSCETVKGSSL